MAMALSAVGSGWGAGIAGMSAIGAWKKNFSQNKSASFMLV
ncbi:V-type ATP synthase subunit K, partial [bacterium]